MAQWTIQGVEKLNLGNETYRPTQTVHRVVAEKTGYFRLRTTLAVFFSRYFDRVTCYMAG